MAAPQVVEVEATGDDDPVDEQPDDQADDVEQPEPKDDGPDRVETVDLADDEIGGGLFSGVEDASADETSEAGGDGDGASDTTQESGTTENASEDTVTSAMASNVNDGMARLGVIGLDAEHKMDDDDDVDCLEGEFRDVFATFQVGQFAERFVTEVLLADAEADQMDPGIALIGSLLAASALVLVMRPDRDEKVEQLKEAASGIAGGVQGAVA